MARRKSLTMRKITGREERALPATGGARMRGALEAGIARPPARHKQPVIGSAAMGAIDAKQASWSSDQIWESEIVPQLTEYIRIPNKSPGYEPNWQANMDKAVALIEAWCRKQDVRGLQVEVVRLKGRTPVIFMEIPGETADTVLLYGHLDKQPEMTGWREGLSPWTPVRDGDKLYGRGAADDGYSSFASLAALRLLQQQKVPHASCVVLRSE